MLKTQSPMSTSLTSDKFNVNRPAVKVLINNSILYILYIHSLETYSNKKKDID